jgi:hypothetical protein
MSLFWQGIVTQFVGGALVALLGVPFWIWFNRNVHILGAGAERAGSPGRQTYDHLRKSLGAGGTAARIYSDWLTRTLNAVEHLFGDHGMANRSLFPQAFGLKKPAPLWTAPAFDRCILFAFIYPILTIVFAWQTSGHVGPAEAAFGVTAALPAWRRGAFGLAFVAAALCYWRFKTVRRLKDSAIWLFFTALGAFAVAAAVANTSDSAGAVAGSVALTSAVVGAIAGDAAVAGVAALTGVLVAVFLVSFWDIGPVASAFVAALPIVLIGAILGHLLKSKQESARRGRSSALLFLILIAAILICMAVAQILAPTKSWRMTGPLLLFFGLLSLLNAPFLWFSVGLTRALLWRGLERKKWWPYFYALVDAVLAVLVIALSAIVMVIAVQFFDFMAVRGGGKPVLPLTQLFNGIAADAAAPENWWVYALLLSTMIPSLVNLTIGGFSLTRGIPSLSRYLHSRMPAGDAVDPFERNWIALALMVQWIVGTALGFFAQALLVLLIFRQVLPTLGLDILDLTRAVAGLDLPHRILGF